MQNLLDLVSRCSDEPPRWRLPFRGKRRNPTLAGSGLVLVYREERRKVGQIAQPDCTRREGTTLRRRANRGA